MEMTVRAGMPPYLASTRWCQGKAGALKTRDYTRTLIGSNSPEGMTLTVPVAGGASAVKRMGPDELMISDHGEWTRIHLGAIEAAYGREPYFQHLFPEIEEIICGYPKYLSDLNVSLMGCLMGFLNFSDSYPEVERLRLKNPQRCSDIRTRLQSKVDPAHSLMEPLFRFGQDTLFML